jgi:hypothetical protein
MGARRAAEPPASTICTTDTGSARCRHGRGRHAAQKRLEKVPGLFVKNEINQEPVLILLVFFLNDFHNVTCSVCMSLVSVRNVSQSSAGQRKWTRVRSASVTGVETEACLWHQDRCLSPGNHACDQATVFGALGNDVGTLQHARTRRLPVASS